MKKICCFLLVLLTLQLCLDETFSHFNLNGSVNLKGSTTFETVTNNLQQLHDHLWLLSAASNTVVSNEQTVVSCNSPFYYIFSDYTFSIWQPPKFL